MNILYEIDIEHLVAHVHTPNGLWTYQNLEVAHIMVDVAKVGSYTSHVGLRVTFFRRTRRGDLQTKGLQCSRKYMS